MKKFHTVFEDLEAIANVVTTENDEEETLRKKVKDADLLIICYTQVTRKVLKSAKKLRGVLKWGVVLRISTLMLLPREEFLSFVARVMAPTQ